MAFNTMHSSGNTGCVDFIIVSNRNILMIEKIFREAAAAPDVWSNHHFLYSLFLASWAELAPIPKMLHTCGGSPTNCLVTIISGAYWPVADIIAELSTYVELRPGDLIYTGTPAGVGRIVAGDVVEGGVDGIGAIANRFL